MKSQVQQKTLKILLNCYQLFNIGNIEQQLKHKVNESASPNSIGLVLSFWSNGKHPGVPLDEKLV